MSRGYDKNTTKLSHSALFVSLFSAALVILTILDGCDDQKEPVVTSEPNTTRVSVVQTDDVQFPIVAGHENGETIWVIAGDVEPDGSTGIIQVSGWTSSSGQSIMVFPGADGLPTHAFFPNATVFLSGYTDSTVDVAYIENGVVRMAAATVPIDPQLISSLRSAVPIPTSPVDGEDNLRTFQDMLFFTSLYVKVAGCAVEGTTAILGGGIAIPLAVASCGSLLIESISSMTSEEIAALEFVGGFMGGFSCGATMTPGSCIPLILDFLRERLEETQRPLLSDDQISIIRAVALNGDCGPCLAQCFDPNTPLPWPCDDYGTYATCSVAGYILCCCGDYMDTGYRWTPYWVSPGRCD